MGIFNFFKEKKPDYGNAIWEFLPVFLLDIYFKKISNNSLKLEMNGKKTSEIKLFDDIIEDVLNPDKHSATGTIKPYVSNETIKSFNIKTENQITHLKELMKDCLLNLTLNDFKYCYQKNDLEPVLDLITQVSNKHNLWKEHYSNLEYGKTENEEKKVEESNEKLIEQLIPDWFDGTLYDEGDTIMIKEKVFSLSAIELSIYDLLMGCFAATKAPEAQSNPNYLDMIKYQKNCIEWFKVENPELYKSLIVNN